MNYSIDHNWCGPTIVGGSWIGHNPSLRTEIKHEWTERRNMVIYHLCMERQSFSLNDGQVVHSSMRIHQTLDKKIDQFRSYCGRC